MRNFVRHFLDGFPLSERDRTLMVLGVDEACTNIIRHAYQLREDQLIALSLESQPDCVRLRLRDYGKQPIPDTLRRPRVNIIKPGGLGLYLIRNLLVDRPPIAFVDGYVHGCLLHVYTRQCFFPICSGDTAGKCRFFDHILGKLG